MVDDGCEQLITFPSRLVEAMPADTMKLTKGRGPATPHAIGKSKGEAKGPYIIALKPYVDKSALLPASGVIDS